MTMSPIYDPSSSYGPLMETIGSGKINYRIFDHLLLLTSMVHRRNYGSWVQPLMVSGSCFKGIFGIFPN